MPLTAGAVSKQKGNKKPDMDRRAQHIRTAGTFLIGDGTAGIDPVIDLIPVGGRQGRVGWRGQPGRARTAAAAGVRPSAVRAPASAAVPHRAPPRAGASGRPEPPRQPAPRTTTAPANPNRCPHPCNLPADRHTEAPRPRVSLRRGRGRLKGSHRGWHTRPHGRACASCCGTGVNHRDRRER